MSEQQSNKPVVTRLVLTVIGMFAFGFLMVPLYDVMCDALGINGKTSGTAYRQEGEHIDES
ncbi:MAG TPA: cytochrome c oxidase assembly protein, partial [Pseudomonas sp.]|nr:cytochrome c oxidase assembly protein [Pseudomonas sp.]